MFLIQRPGVDFACGEKTDGTVMSKFLELNALALFAILLNVLNFIHTFYIGRRDRGNLVVESVDMVVISSKPVLMTIKAVNVGRRPIYITGLAVKLNKGMELIMPVDKEAKGKLLNETDFLEIRLSQHAKYNETHIFDITLTKDAVACWFVDSAGRKYYAKNFRKHIKRMFAENNESKRIYPDPQ